MRKVGAILLALVMAVPALAQSVCAATCSDGPAARISCCCASASTADDGAPVYSAPSCCPSPAAGTEQRELAGAVDNGAGASAVRGPGRVLAVQSYHTATDVASPSAASLAGEPAGGRATGPPIFIAVSSLRL